MDECRCEEEAKYVLDVDDYYCVTIRTKGRAKREKRLKYQRWRSKESPWHVAM